MKVAVIVFALAGTSIASAQVSRIELTPSDVGSASNSFFTSAPTVNAANYFGTDYGTLVRSVNFNTAPDGPLVEGGNVNSQYASLGVTMNDIRITSSIFGGNNYGAGFATEDNIAQIFSFSTGVKAVGIVNTSPDGDLVSFYSGQNATGTLLFSFRDQTGSGINFNIDRFVGGVADSGVTIGSFVVSNSAGDLELDELVFVVPEPASIAALSVAILGLVRRRRS